MEIRCSAVVKGGKVWSTYVFQMRSCGFAYLTSHMNLLRKYKCFIAKQVALQMFLIVIAFPLNIQHIEKGFMCKSILLKNVFRVNVSYQFAVQWVFL
jgi:hypothetical protein